jgi:hypothetical protein
LIKGDVVPKLEDLLKSGNPAVKETLGVMAIISEHGR